MENAIYEGLKSFTGWLAMMFVVGMVINWLYNVSPLGRDDSDPPGGRSDMKVLTDNKTGLQYLATRGGVTPRLGLDGKQIRKEVEATK